MKILAFPSMAFMKRQWRVRLFEVTVSLPIWALTTSEEKTAVFRSGGISASIACVFAHATPFSSMHFTVRGERRGQSKSRHA